MLVSRIFWATWGCGGDFIHHTRDVVGGGFFWFLGFGFGTHFCVIDFVEVMGIYWVALG